MDELTGVITEDFVHPLSVQGMYKEGTSGFFGVMNEEDIKVYFRENLENTSKDNTLTFRFMTKDYEPISPRKFSKTDEFASWLRYGNDGRLCTLQGGVSDSFE